MCVYIYTMLGMPYKRPDKRLYAYTVVREEASKSSRVLISSRDLLPTP